MKRKPAADVFTDLVFEVFRINGRILGAGERLTVEFDLTTARWQVLGAVGIGGPQTVAQIARYLGLQRQSVQRTVDLLAEEHCVLFKRNPNHARAKLVEITLDGRQKLNQIGKRQIVWANRIVGDMPAQEIADAVTVLRALRERLENDEPA